MPKRRPVKPELTVTVRHDVLTVSWLDLEAEVREIAHRSEPLSVWVDADGHIGGLRRRFGDPELAQRVAGDYRDRARFARPDGAGGFIGLIDRHAKRRYQGSMSIPEVYALISVDADGVPLELEFEDDDRIPAGWRR